MKEWYREGCTCPKMDNDDAGMHMYFTVGCPLHLTVDEYNKKFSWEKID